MTVKMGELEMWFVLNSHTTLYDLINKQIGQQYTAPLYKQSFIPILCSMLTEGSFFWH